MLAFQEFSFGPDKADKAALVARFAAEGKVPKGEDGCALTDAQLHALDCGLLELLLANTPPSVPLASRQRSRSLRYF